jgi:hypothetical protein
MVKELSEIGGMDLMILVVRFPMVLASNRPIRSW